MKKNYREGALAPDTEGLVYDGYAFCFAHPDYTQNVDPDTPVGHRIFPDDDTPRTFVNCNLLNATPPPGSTVTGCNTTIARNERRLTNPKNAPPTEKRENVPKYEQIIYGHTDKVTLEAVYKPKPVKNPGKGPR